LKINQIDTINDGDLVSNENLFEIVVDEKHSTVVASNPSDTKEDTKIEKDNMTKEVKHEERQHAEFSPSRLNYLEQCGSFCQNQDNDPIYAEAGTRQHEAMETRDFSKLKDEWEVAAVKRCIDFIDSHMDKGDKLIQEIRLDMVGQFGFVDVLIIKNGGKKGIIIDAKFGKTPVPDAEINRQGHAYALGAFAKFPELEDIDIWFIAPHINQATTGSLKRSDVPRITTEINAIIERAKAGGHYNPSAYCSYCGLAGKCPKLMEKALTVISRYDGDNIPVPTQIHSSQITDPADMAKALALAKLMSKWCDSVEKHAKDMAVNGIEIPGWELAEKKGYRRL
jgi:hypothetical protein